MKPRLLLILILLVAAVLRILWLDKYPAGFTPDEASFGYDAYSILKTGKDQWGESFPLTFRSFGDFKAPLYTYLAIPSVAVFGLNEFAVRLPNAILGVLAVLATYLLVKELFKKLEIGNWKLEILAATLLAVSPWHISLSRGAFEANLTTFLMPLGVYAFLKGLKDGRWMIVSAFAFGINLFSYHSARLVTPLVVLALIWLGHKKLTKGSISMYQFIKAKYVFLIVFGLFLAVSMVSVLSGGGNRASDVAIFNPTGGWGVVADRRYEGLQAGLPDAISRLFSNKLTYVASEFTKNYLTYLSPTFLFTQGAGEATYGMIPGFGVLYLFELPFIGVALWVFVKRPKWDIGFILAWIILSPIPAALTKGPGFAANRAAVMMPAIQILSAYGGMALWQMVKNIKHLNSNLKQIGLLGYWVIGIMGFLFFLEAYFYHAPRNNAHSMSYGWRQAVEYIQSVEENYNEIIISRAFSEPHIFVAFHKKWDPSDYQKQAQHFLRYEKQGLLFVDQLGEYKLGKYTFRDIRYFDDGALENTLLVGRARDFPETIEPLETILFPDSKKAMLIVNPISE